MWEYLDDNLELCTCSPGQEEEFSEMLSLDTDVSVPLKKMPSADLSSLPASETELCHDFQYGMTLKRLTDTLGKERLMWCVGDSPVRTYHRPDTALELEAKKVDCGLSSPGSLARYNPLEYSWRTAHALSPEVWMLYSETLPAWGTMRNGELFLRPIPEEIISVRESGSVPIPIEQAVSVCPTDICQETGGGNLTRLRYPTPRACSAMSATLTESNYNQQYFQNLETVLVRRFPEVLGKRINPEWLEWLMGWPIGWTALLPLETDRFQQWLQLHGVS